MLKYFTRTGLAWWWLSALVIAVDQFSKWWAVNFLHYHSPMKILPFLNFTLAFNRGAAFSFLHQASGWQNGFLAGLAISVSAFILVWLSRNPKQMRWMNISLSLILAGALGNVIDRMQHGYVIDFIDFFIGNNHFAIFNIADSAISIGAAMMVLHWVFFD